MANRNEIDTKRSAEVIHAPGSENNPLCFADVCREIAGPLFKSWAKEAIELLPRQQTAAEMGRFNAYALAGKFSAQDAKYDV